MIARNIKPVLNQLLDKNPAVVLIGPRQVGKTTLAREVADERDALYLDLERPSDLAKIADIEQYCDENANHLLILDEVHRAPGPTSYWSAAFRLGPATWGGDSSRHPRYMSEIAASAMHCSASRRSTNCSGIPS